MLWPKFARNEKKPTYNSFFSIHNLKKFVYHEKNHISSPLQPIDLKFGMVVDFMNIYHKKNFRKFGAKFEFLEPFKNLRFQKKLISQHSLKNFFYNFWRQILGFTANLSQIFRFFGSQNSNLAPKMLKKF